MDIANLASINNGKRLGRRKIGYAGYLKWFERCITFRTPAVERIGFQFFNSGAESAEESPVAEPAPVGMLETPDTRVPVSGR